MFMIPKLGCYSSKVLVLDFWSKTTQLKVQRDIYSTFFDKSGVIIIKNVYKKNLMDKYNQWCEETLEKTKNDPNARHPKQKHKYLINDLWNRMGDTDPNMLLDLLADRTLNTVQDVLLGFCKYGAATTHWIEPGGDRQVISKSLRQHDNLKSSIATSIIHYMLAQDRFGRAVWYLRDSVF